MDAVSYCLKVFRKPYYRKLSVLGKRLMREGVEELKRILDRSHVGVFHLLGFTECVQHSTFTLIMANYGGSQLEREVMVLDEQRERSLLPYRSADDFFAFAELLGIQSVPAYAALVSFIQPSPYGLHKIVPPTHIKDATDALACHVVFLDSYQQYVEGHNSLWAGSNSHMGYLYVLTLDTQQTPPLMEVNFILPESK